MQARARELESDCLKAVAEQERLHELLTTTKNRAEHDENRANQADKLRQEEEQRNTELSVKVGTLEANLAKKVEELADEVATAKVDKVI